MPDDVDLTDFDESIRSDGQQLRIDVILEQLPQKQENSLRAALTKTDRYSHMVVSRTVTGWGHPVGPTAVRNWRERNV